MSVLKFVRDGKALAYRLDGAALILGAAPGCQIVLQGEGVLPRHCQILPLPQGTLLKDLSNGQGVVVNGKKVRERILCDGDVLQIGPNQFTFSGTPGQNTARVAIQPAAAAPAPTTQRRPPGSTTRSTKTVSPGTTRSMSKKSGSTGRVTARMSRPVPTFSLPTTRKGKLIGVGVVLGIVGLTGLLMMARAGQVRPEDVKAELALEVQKIEKMPATDFAGRSAAVEALLANENYKKYGNEYYRELVKVAPKYKEAAKNEREADKEVKPFLAKYEAAKAKKDTFDATSATLYDEGKALLDRHHASLLAARLNEVIAALKAHQEGIVVVTWEKDFVRFTADVQTEKNKGNCARAMKLIEEFAEKFKEKETPALAKKLVEQRDPVRRHSDVVVDRLKKDVAKLLAEGNKADARKLVEAAKPGLEGFPAALAKLPPLLKEIEGTK